MPDLRHGDVAQSVERPFEKREVGGSSPSVPTRPCLTEPQYRMLDRLIARGEVFVHGATRNVANRLAEKGLVRVDFHYGVGPRAVITDAGRDAIRAHDA